MMSARKITLATSVFELPPLGFDHEIFQINLSYLEDLYYVCIMSLDHHSVKCQNVKPFFFFFFFL